MKEHTKEKLWVYREYLKNYLSVMSRTGRQKIFVWEPFAGMGLDENKEMGSALIAARMIKAFREGKHRKNIQLFLNELDKKEYEELKQAVSKYESFVHVFNSKAQDFLSAVHTSLEKFHKDVHNLFFIDPYGYTQYSQDNLRQLLTQRNSEYLIFIPTNHIYRFKKTENNPARKFVLDLGVKESVLKNINTIDSFAEELTEKLKELADAEFGYNYKLENKEVNSSIFHLFFVTRHITGAVKFLEAKNLVRKKLESQLTLFDAKEPEILSALEEILCQERTNEELFVEIIKKGHLPKEVNPILRKLELRGDVEVASNVKRPKGAFYLNRKPDKIINIRYKR